MALKDHQIYGTPEEERKIDSPGRLPAQKPDPLLRERKELIGSLLNVLNPDAAELPNTAAFQEKMKGLGITTPEELKILTEVYTAVYDTEQDQEAGPEVRKIALVALRILKESREEFHRVFTGVTKEELIQNAQTIQRKKSGRLMKQESTKAPEESVEVRKEKFIEMLGEINAVVNLKSTDDILREVDKITDASDAEKTFLTQLKMVASSISSDDQRRAVCTFVGRIITLFSHGNRPRISLLAGVKATEIKDIALQMFGKITIEPTPPESPKTASRKIVRHDTPTNTPNTGRVNLDFVEAALKATKESGATSQPENEAPFLVQFAIQQIQKEIARLESPEEKEKLKNEMRFMVLQTLRKILSLLQKIGINSSSIPEARAKRAADYGQRSLRSIKNLVKRAEEKPRFAYFDLPDTIRRSIGQMRSIANNVTVGSKEEIQQMKEKFSSHDSHARSVLDTLAGIFSESEKLDPKKITNISAEELIGDLLETPHDEHDEEWTEYLMIHAAGGLIDFKIKPKTLEKLAQRAGQEEGNLIKSDEKKIGSIHQKLMELAAIWKKEKEKKEKEEKEKNDEKEESKSSKAPRSELEKIEEKEDNEDNEVNLSVSMTRAITYANGLIARIVLTPKSGKQRSTFERFFSRYLDNIEITFRMMNYITERSMERSTTKLLRAMKPSAPADTEETLEPSEDVFSDDWIK